MPFGIQIIKNTKRFPLTFFFFMKLQYAQYAQLVQYALYKINEHYNELVVHMKQTSASCYT